MKTNIAEQIEGYNDIVKENEVLRKYSKNSSVNKGEVPRVINLYHPKKLILRLSEIRPETESTTTFRFIADKGYLPPFQAGQYINIFVEIDGIRTSRPYSISSTPNQIGYYDITVRRVPDGFVSSYLLDSLKVGETVESTSPSGQFYYNPLFHGDDLVFIAGGSGITPFMSMIREVTDRELRRNIHLIYGSRIESDIVFEDELRDRAKRHSNFTLTPVVSEPTNGYDGIGGFITADLITTLTESTNNKMFYVCGPEAMYKFVLSQLEKLQIPRRKRRVEVFGPPADVSGQPGWPEEIDINTEFEIIFNGNKAIKARAGEPLMNSLERHGFTLESSCRSGECSLCRTKLLSGKVFHANGANIRRSDEIYHYIHPCMAYPLENLELRT